MLGARPCVPHVDAVEAEPFAGDLGHIFKNNTLSPRSGHKIPGGLSAASTEALSQRDRQQQQRAHVGDRAGERAVQAARSHAPVQTPQGRRGHVREPP